MQLKNKGRGVMIGQRDGLSNCDELKIRRWIILIYYCTENLENCLFVETEVEMIGLISMRS